MKILDQNKDRFLQLLVDEGKSLETISLEMQIPVRTLRDWDRELEEEIVMRKAIRYDEIREDHGLSELEKLDYLGQLYNRLKDELNKRDFSGLPTDKLYHILMDVRRALDNHLQDKGGNWDDRLLEDDFDLGE